MKEILIHLTTDAEKWYARVGDQDPYYITGIGRTISDAVKILEEEMYKVDIMDKFGKTVKEDE